MANVRVKESAKKQSSLETANEIFKMAFLIKKAKFSSSDPNLTDSQLNQKTALYFRKISEKNK